jgi:hypothetical protein
VATFGEGAGSPDRRRPDGLFQGEQVDGLIDALHGVHGNAVA